MKYIDKQYYHIFNRGAHKGKIFFSDENYYYCLRLVKKYTEIYKLEILAYCLMPNHYHFILQQKQSGSISRFLQTTFNAYSQAINKAIKHSGTLFQGRAKGILTDTDEHLIHLVRYIHLNPVVARLVSKPEEWEFSDYNEWIGESNFKYSGEKLRQNYFKEAKEYKLFVDEYRHKQEILLLTNYLYPFEGL